MISYDKSYNEYGKVVHRPYRKCISSIQKLNEDFIKFFLLTQIRSRIKYSLLSFILELNFTTQVLFVLDLAYSYSYNLIDSQLVVTIITSYLHI